MTNENEAESTPIEAVADPSWAARLEEQQREKRREFALTMAVQTSTSPNWSGHAGNIVGIALVFEGYLKTGLMSTEDQIQNIRAGLR